MIGGVRPRFFRNTGGGFEESGALPDIDRPVRVALFFDHDLSGYDDLLLLPLDEPAVFLENYEGVYRERAIGLERSFVNPTAAAAGDYTRNGFPDIFIAQNGNWRIHPPAGLYEYPVAPPEDNGESNHLFAGNGTEYVETTK